MGESRERFVEAAEIVLSGLEQGWCEYNGKFYRQAARDIRPRPSRTFKGRTYAAAVSPESVEIMARLGIGILVIPQKPWHVIDRELSAYRRIFQEVNGAPAPAPIIAGWVFCDPDEQRAREMATRWIGGYWETARKHYEIGGAHFANTKGYEFYASMSEVQQQSAAATTEAYLDLQVWGHAADVHRPHSPDDGAHAVERVHVRLQLRGHALRRGRAQPAALRPGSGCRRCGRSRRSRRGEPERSGEGRRSGQLPAARHLGIVCNRLRTCCKSRFDTFAFVRRAPARHPQRRR